MDLSCDLIAHDVINGLSCELLTHDVINYWLCDLLTHYVINDESCGMASAFGASVCGSEYRDTRVFRTSAYIAISISCSVTDAHDAWNLMGLKRRGGKGGGDQWLVM